MHLSLRTTFILFLSLLIYIIVSYAGNHSNKELFQNGRFKYVKTIRLEQLIIYENQLHQTKGLLKTL